MLSPSFVASTFTTAKSRKYLLTSFLTNGSAAISVLRIIFAASRAFSRVSNGSSPEYSSARSEGILSGSSSSAVLYWFERSRAKAVGEMAIACNRREGRVSDGEKGREKETGGNRNALPPSF